MFDAADRLAAVMSRALSGLLVGNIFDISSSAFTKLVISRIFLGCVVLVRLFRDCD